MLFENTYYTETKNNYKSLQAQAVTHSILMIKRASCCISRVQGSRECSIHPGKKGEDYCIPRKSGSATVEAALVLPVFLCAVCFLIMMGQLLLVEGEIAHALSKTAMVCASQESVKDQAPGASAWKSLPVQFIEANGAFYSFLQGEDLCKECIVGGRRGILVTMKESKEDGCVTVTARYILRIPIPFFRNGQIHRNLSARRRIYNGYIPAGTGDDDNDPLVYLAANGSVYHTSISCSHISLRISGSSQAVKMLDKKGLRPCEKCMKKGSIPNALYITAEGDCYHSKVSCSGLKRTVRMVRLSEVGGMKRCSRCGKKIE